MHFTNALAGIAVSDITKATKWYTEFLGRDPDRVPMSSDVEWDFPGGATLQVFDDKRRAGHSSLTLVPDDFKNEVERLANLGHRPSDSKSGKFEIAIFADPDGNRLVLAQPN